MLLSLLFKIITFGLVSRDAPFFQTSMLIGILCSIVYSYSSVRKYSFGSVARIRAHVAPMKRSPGEALAISIWLILFVC